MMSIVSPKVWHSQELYKLQVSYRSSALWSSGKQSKARHEWIPTVLCGPSPPTVSLSPKYCFPYVLLGFAGSVGYANISEMRGASKSTLICHCSRILWFGLEMNKFTVHRPMLSTCLLGGMSLEIIEKAMLD